MKITEGQVLDLVKCLNNNFDGTFELQEDSYTNRTTIVTRDTILSSDIAYIDDLSIVTILTTRTALRCYISIWANSLKDREQYVPTNKHFRLNNSESVIDSILLEAAEKLSSLYNSGYGKRHSVEVASALVTIKRGLKD